MKIGMITVGSVPSGVDQLVKTFIHRLVKRHEIVGIEIDRFTKTANYKEIDEEIFEEYHESKSSLFHSSPLFSLVKQHLSISEVFAAFDAVVVIGGNEARLELEEINKNLHTKILFIPASVSNDIPESQLSLGYDSALNTIATGILRIEDTANSMKYDLPRLFCIQIPGRSNEMVSEAALAVNGIAMHTLHDNKAVETVKQTFASGQTYAFVIVNETISFKEAEEKFANAFEVDWRITQIDDAQCMGPYPTAADRILAGKLAKRAAKWIETKENSGKLFIQNHGVVFKQDSNPFDITSLSHG
ncbi:6-phosphofructokinase [Bacillus taeanensis]|nr:6-phosphofructokinase [Bacillus taeanensis]